LRVYLKRKQCLRLCKFKSLFILIIGVIVTFIYIYHNIVWAKFIIIFERMRDMEIKKLKVKSAEINGNLEMTLNSKITRNSDIDATDLDGEVVMMNLEKGQYFMMNQVGSRIWEIIKEPSTVNNIINTLLGEFQVEKNQCKENVVEFLGKLKNANLISIN